MAELTRSTQGTGGSGTQDQSLYSVQAALSQMMGQAPGTQPIDQAGFRSQLQALLSQLDSLGPSQNELQNDDGEPVIDIREGEEESNALLKPTELQSKKQRIAHSIISAQSDTNIAASASARAAGPLKEVSKEQALLDEEIFARLDQLMEEEQAAGSSSEDDAEDASEQSPETARPTWVSSTTSSTHTTTSPAVATPGLFMPAALSLEEDSDEGVDVLPAFLPAILSLEDGDADLEDMQHPNISSSKPAALSDIQLHALITSPALHKPAGTPPALPTTAQLLSTPSPSNQTPLISKPYSVLHINSASATVPSSPISATVPSSAAFATGKHHQPESADSSYSPAAPSPDPSQSTSPQAHTSPPPAVSSIQPNSCSSSSSSTAASTSSSKGSGLRRGFFPASSAPPKPRTVQKSEPTAKVPLAQNNRNLSLNPAPSTPAITSSGKRVSFASDCTTVSAEDKSDLSSRSGSTSQPSSSKVMQAVAVQDASVFTGQVMEHSSRDRQEPVASRSNSLPGITSRMVHSTGSKGTVDANAIPAAALGIESNDASLPAAPMSKFKQRRLGLA